MLRIFSYRSLLVATTIALTPFALNAQTTASVTCKDGTTSTASGRGACSGHGGVGKSTAKAKSDTKAPKADTKVAKADTKSASKAAKADTKADAKVAKASTTSASAMTAPATKTATSDAANATAKCKDGTFSHAASRRGACSRHGGVSEWLKS